MGFGEMDFGETNFGEMDNPVTKHPFDEMSLRRNVHSAKWLRQNGFRRNQISMS
jgi:hypothetical protein